MAIISGSSTILKEVQPVIYEIAGYPQYSILMESNSKFFIKKEGEPVPYLKVIYANLYSAVTGVQTIEAFKELMRAKKAAKELSVKL